VQFEKEKVAWPDGTELRVGGRLPEVEFVEGLGGAGRKAAQVIKPLIIRDAGEEFHGSLTGIRLWGMPIIIMGQTPWA
jgi:hypothetical protein